MEKLQWPELPQTTQAKNATLMSAYGMRCGISNGNGSEDRIQISSVHLKEEYLMEVEGQTVTKKEPEAERYSEVAKQHRRSSKTGLKKYFPPKELLLFVFLMGTSTTMGEKTNAKLTIKKCCPKNQELNSIPICVNATGDSEDNEANKTGDVGENALYSAQDPFKISFLDFNDSSAESNFTLAREFPWFPFASLISSETLQQVTDFGTLRGLLKEANFEYGAHPECVPEEKEWSCFRAQFSEWFHLLLYPEQDIKLYVSKKYSNHDQRHFKIDDRNCGFLEVGPSEDNGKAKGGDWAGNWVFNVDELKTFPSGDFCVDKGPQGSFLVEYCPCRTVPCLRKCCSDSELFDGRQQKCVSNSTFGFWRPSLENSSLTRNYYLLSDRFPSSCEKPHWLKIPVSANLNFKKSCGNVNQEEKNKFYFCSDGSLKVKRYQMSIPAQSYCGDHVIYDSENFLENNILMCLEDGSSLPKFRVYGILFVIGGIVLLVTVAISLYLPELRSSVHNKVIICHNLSLMFADFIWGSTYLLPKVTRSICIFLSLAIQCTFLTSFFWMNVMCLDISLGIRRLKSAVETVDDGHKFLRYLIYAFGAPIIITSITAAMEFAPSLPPHYVRPGLGCYNCGFNPDSPSILIYVYGPMIAIILLNLIFFIMTVFQIVKIQKETAILDGQKSSASIIKNGKKRLVIFGKLFLLMGLSWIMEIVSWLVGGKDYYWYFPDFVNILRAVFIFTIVICKKKVLRSLVAKLKGCPEGSDEASKSRKSTTAEYELEEVRRRETVFRKQIGQTLGRSEESDV